MVRGGTATVRCLERGRSEQEGGRVPQSWKRGRRWLLAAREWQSADASVRAAEWLSDRRRTNPTRRMVLGLVAVIALMSTLDMLLATSASTGLLWVPLLVVTVAIHFRAGTVLCVVVGIVSGVVADATDGVALALVAGDAVLRVVGYTLVVVLASWTVLSTTELTRRSRTDSSTGLLNRCGFIAAVERERQRALRTDSTLSLVYFDLDGLKRANDRHGHDYGDVLLDRFARHLDGSRRILDVPGRLGGDEFALLLPATDSSGVEQVLRRLFRSIDRDERCLTVSAGAVTWLHPPSAASMLRVADQLMYDVKQRGGRDWRTVVIDEPSPDDHVGHHRYADGDELRSRARTG